MVNEIRSVNAVLFKSIISVKFGLLIISSRIFSFFINFVIVFFSV